MQRHPQQIEDELLKRIEYCGRVCTDTFEKITPTSAAPFVNRLLKRGHASVLEHVWHRIKVIPLDSYTFERNIVKNHWAFRFLNITENGGVWMIEGSYRAFLAAMDACPYFRFKQLIEKFPVMYGFVGEPAMSVLKLQIEDPIVYSCDIICDRRTSHQAVRHDAGISQRSQRYTAEPTNVHFIIPLDLEGIIQPGEYHDDSAFVDNENTCDYYEVCSFAESKYHSRLRRGYAAEDARDVLPNLAMTRLILTWDESNWNHLFSLRCDSHADKPIRRLMTHFQSEVKDANKHLWG